MPRSRRTPSSNSSNPGIDLLVLNIRTGLEVAWFELHLDNGEKIDCKIPWYLSPAARVHIEAMISDDAEARIPPAFKGYRPAKWIAAALANSSGRQPALATTIHQARRDLKRALAKEFREARHPFPPPPLFENGGGLGTRFRAKKVDLNILP